MNRPQQHQEYALSMLNYDVIGEFITIFWVLIAFLIYNEHLSSYLHSFIGCRVAFKD